MPAKPNSRGSILIVEDEPDVRETLAAVFEEEGYHVACAPHGAEALSCLHRCPLPGIILLDLQMPVMDGWEFSRRQRQHPAVATIPLIILTGAYEDMRRPAPAGAVGYFMKPYNIDALINVVARACRQIGEDEEWKDWRCELLHPAPP
jgi:CheY-like chemotaxis protein